MRTFLLLLFTYTAVLLKAQTTADFESFNLSSNSFLNGSDGNGGFTDGNIFLPNDYAQASDSWQGWSISTATDTETPGPSNQFSVIAGTGHAGTEHYATAYAFANQNIILEGNAAGRPVSGFYINNSTYAYLSMLNGDSFAKKFGGVSGNDEDFYLLTVRKYFEGILSEEKVEFYLADYRFADNSQDYIINEWTYVDLSSLGKADSLSFSLSSSDEGAFGMNTPAYFCIDDFTTSDGTVSVSELSKSSELRLSPNPTSGVLYLKGADFTNFTYQIVSVTGEVLQAGELTQEQSLHPIDLPQGLYSLVLSKGTTLLSQKFTIVK